MAPLPSRPRTRFSPRLARAALLLALASALATCGREQPDPSGPGTPGPEPPAARRPNLVVIMTDDQTVETVRVMEQTRSLIGSQGVTFSNSVVTYALCCPSRATLLTGQYPHNHGVRSNDPPDGGHARLDHGNTLPLWLRDAGYVTGHIGKYLNGYGTLDPLELPPGWTEFYASTAGTEFNYYDFQLNENGTLVSYGSTADHYQTDVYTGKAVDFVARRAPAAAGGDAPFFLFVAYLAPHSGNPVEPGDPALANPVPAPRHKGRFAAERLPATPSFNEADVSDKPESMRTRPLLTAGRMDQIQQAYRQQLESLLAVDEGVGRIVDALRAGGVLANTIIMFTSDNGYFRGEHRVASGKILPYEPAVRVPLLVRGPSIQPGRTLSEPVANVDLAPTIVAAAGARSGLTMDGRSLLPFLSGGQTTWPDAPRHVLVEDSQLGTAASVFLSIRREGYVYTEYANGDRELYDLAADSAQVSSEHASEAYSTVREELASRLAAMRSCRGPTACW
jgi:N-acetylglucosamine-6-sulfatase